jgi:DNA-binding beta-propeller fold protein YncE
MNVYAGALVLIVLVAVVAAVVAREHLRWPFNPYPTVPVLLVTSADSASNASLLRLARKMTMTGARPYQYIAALQLGVQNSVAVSFDSAGYLYVAAVIKDPNNPLPKGEIQIFAPGSTAFARPARRITGLIQPTGLALDFQDNLYVADLGAVALGSALSTSRVLKYPPGADGAADSVLVAEAQPNVFNYAGDVAVDPQGDVYVAATLQAFSGTHRVVVFEPQSDGTYKNIAFLGPKNVDPSLNWLSNPQQIALDGKGNLYVVDAAAPPQIIVFGVPLAALANPIGAVTCNLFQTPWGVAIDDNTGQIFVADSGAQSVFIFDRSAVSPIGASINAQPQEIISGPSSHFTYPFGLALKSPLLP